MNNYDILFLSELTIVHQTAPLGIDCRQPRFGWKLQNIKVTVWDNKGRSSYIESKFETGRLGHRFLGSWVTPEQIHLVV